MPPAVWPEFAPPLTLSTTETGALVPRSSSATSGIRRPLPSSPREIPTSAMSWLVKGSRDIVARETKQPARDEALLPQRENATRGVSANKIPADDAWRQASLPAGSKSPLRFHIRQARRPAATCDTPEL